MKKAIIFLFFLITILGFSVVIRTNESGVGVYINNVLKYTVDGTQIVLEKEWKIANIKLSLPGFWPVNFELQGVDLSSTQVIEVNFYPITEGTITGIPETSEIYIVDGSVEIFLGKAPYEGILPLGRHIFKVITPDGAEYTVERNITAQTQTINLYKPWSKTLIIDSTPKAALYIDGIYRGITPSKVTLGFGEHTFEFYNKKFLVGSCKLNIMDNDVKVLKKDIVGMVKSKDRLHFKLKRIIKTKIVSVPEGVYFRLGKKVYRTPEVVELPESTNVIEAFIPGYESKRIVFNPGIQPTVRIELKPNRKHIQVDFHGDIFVNGEYEGSGPTSLSLMKGIYVFEFVSGGERWLKLVDPIGDVELNVDRTKGTLVIGDIGIVRLNGQTILTPAILNLSPGNYELDRVLKDGTSITETLSVEKGKVTYYPKHSALLFVNTSPSLVKVNLGFKYYTTPIVLIPTEPGKVDLEFFYKCATFKKTVDVKENKVNYINISFNIDLKEADDRCPVVVEEK